MTSGTTSEAKADILADFWIEYKGKEDFTDFFAFNDLGLPLAYSISHGIVKATDTANTFIAETFDILLELLGLEDEGFETMEDVITRYGA